MTTSKKLSTSYQNLQVIYLNKKYFFYFLLVYEIPSWFLNRRKDPKDGTDSQQTTNNWDTKLREDLEKMKKMKLHKGLRHYFGLRVRGQHTCSTGRRGKTMGVTKKK